MANVNWLKTARVKVPNRSGFDKSFRNLLTAKVGTLVPLLCDEVIPGTRVNLKLALQASLPPLASDTFMRCKLKTEAFFVPNRLLYGGYEAWLTGDKLHNDSSYVDVQIPVLSIDASKAGEKAFLNPGTLADYLGYRMSTADITAMGNTTSQYFNIFPFVAYHRIYDDWYRNTKVQNKVFSRPTNSATLTALSGLPFRFYSVNQANTFSLSSLFYDGVALGSLRQRNFGSDYFTESTPLAQQGDPQKVAIDTSDDTFTISALRAANSIQQWLERNNLAGFRLQDYVRANYGASLSDGVAQRTLFLGSEDFDVYTKGVEQNTSTDIQGVGQSNNPFSTTGARYGNAYATGDGSLINDFTANEPGYIFVMASLVPHVSYSSGILRQNLRYAGQNTQSELATPLLQNVGNQPVYITELCAPGAWGATPNAVFGYTDRYADFMTREDETHGLLRDGESLAAFAAQRNIAIGAQISSNFLAIPTNYLDGVTAVSASLSNYGVWIDSYLDYKISQPLAQYCQPSLQDPAYEHGKDVTVRRSGSRL